MTPLPGLTEGRTLTGDQSLDAEVVVVGTGAGGAPVAWELARAGRDVILLEAGPHLRDEDFTQRLPEMLPRLYWDRGGRVTEGGAFTVSQGRCVGGSTVHYTAWAMRPPRPILDHWYHHRGIPDLAPADVDPLVDTVERVLSTRPVRDEEINAHNRVVRRGAEALELRGGACYHHRVDCLGCGYCLLGCAYGRKQTMANTFVPGALEAGARLISDAHVERIRTRGARVEGVRAKLLDGDGTPHGTLTVRADTVVLSAGAIHSPILLRTSGIGDASGQVGRNLVFHTTTTVFGLFDEEIHAHRGFAPAWVVDAFLDLGRSLDHGYYLVPAFAPPGAIAPFLPGLGASHAALMRAYPRIAGLSVLLHDSSSGTVTTDGGGAPVIAYELGELDRKLMLEGMIHAGRLLFAAGASEVFASTVEGHRFRSPAALEPLHGLGPLEHRVALNTPHPQGTCRMGSDRRTSVVDPWGRSHDVRGLYVSDMSTFPTSLGAPPSTTVAALALRTARRILSDLPSAPA